MPVQFDVGERVIMQLGTYYAAYDGTEAVVVEPLALRRCKDKRNMEWSTNRVYIVRVLDPYTPFLVAARPWQLRKLKDPLPDKSGQRAKKRKTPEKEIV